MAMVSRGGLARRVNDGNLKWWTLIAACFALFMAILDNLVVNVALPTISRDLDAGTTQLQWIVSAYTLVFASLQITAGGLGDRLGRKRWFLLGIIVFTAASVMAALSQNIETLLAARAIQGLGGALILPLSLSLISVAFPPEERGRALGIWSAVSVSSIALGPIVGGALVEYANWHWVFLINVPIGIAAFFVTSAVVEESRDTSGTVATDIPGTALITGGIASLTWGLIEAGNRGWTDRWILTAFAAAAVLGLVFIVVESRTARPMVPLRFFRSSTFTGANIDAFAISFLIAGVAFFMTLYQQNIHGFSAVRTGLALLPMVITMMVCSPISGQLVSRTGPSKLISLGMLISGIGTLLLLRSGVDASSRDIVPGFVVMGLGMSLIWAPMTTAVLNSVESEKSGVASAINGAVREIGTAFGIALLGTVMNRTYQSRFNDTADIKTLRGNDGLTGVLDLIGSGASFAGHVVAQLPMPLGRALPDAVVAQIQDASGRAFVTGMHQAIMLSSAVIIVCSVISYVLVKDRVFATATSPSSSPDDALAPVVAD